VRGGADAYLSVEAAAEMQALAPDCRIVVVPRTGHCLMGEGPAAFAAAVRAFLDEAASPAGTPARVTASAR